MHAYHRTVGSGHLSQGRYQAFAIEADEHVRIVCGTIFVQAALGNASSGSYRLGQNPFSGQLGTRAWKGYHRDTCSCLKRLGASSE